MSDRVDLGRRDLLKQGSTLGVAALAGCACPMPSWRMGDPPPLRPGALAPPAPKEGSLAVPIVMDAHCHIFNVEDVPAAAFLSGPATHIGESENDEDNGRQKALIKALAKIVAAIAEFLAPSARAELRMLEEVSDKHAASPAAAADEVDRRLDAQWQRFSELFSAAAYRQNFPELYARQRKFYLDALGPQTRALETDDELSVESIYARLKAGPRSFSLGIRAFDPGQLIYFAFSVTAPRYLNLRYLQKTYCGGSGSPAVDVFCPSQLDFNHWLNCRDSATTQDDQVRLLERIAVMSGGTILPLVAYNPLTDVLQDNASFGRVVKAITKCGFVGVKIYPPMGFRPYGSAPHARVSTCPVRADAKQIDDRLAYLYAWCFDHNVPVMAHTSHSFGPTEAEDECAAPVGWQRALAKVPGLRVQAGHFGGESKYALEQGKWAAEYVRMMAAPGSENLYVDVSNLGGLFTPDSEVNKVIGPLVFRPIAPGSPEIVADRMVYGSDWYMTQLTELSGEYLSQASEFLGGVECQKGVPGLRNRILGLNALRLYGLDPGPKGGRETNWDRLTDYYNRVGIGTPHWMQKVTPPRPPDRC